MNASPGLHPSEETLIAYGLGKANENTAAFVARHLEICSACRACVANLSADSFVDRLQMAKAPGSTSLPDKSLSALGRGVQVKPSKTRLPRELADCEQYEEIRELGKGGMGVVYLAKNKLMGRDEVLKVVNKSMLERPGAIERFLREIQSAARLQHPNVVAAYSAMQLGELLVFAMEYVPGQDLAQVARNADRPLPVQNASFYAYQTALGLQHAFEKGMVHRDIKPSNLILTKEGKKPLVKILDFGLAKVSSEKSFDAGLTGEGKMLGTPDFMAPEQAMDAANADIRADIYSLGCTLHYLLIGRPPFAANSLLELLQHHQGTEAQSVNLLRPDVPVELGGVVARMMAKDPRKRYQAPSEVAKVLAPFVKSGPAVKPIPEVSRGLGETAETKGTAPLLPVGVARKPVAKSEALPATPAANTSAPVPGQAQIVVDPWGSLSETSGTRPTLVARPAPTRTVVKKRSWRWQIVAAGVLVAVLIGLLASDVFRVKTKDGVIVLQILPPGAEVLVDGDTVTVIAEDGKAVEIRVDPNKKHRLEVRKEGFKSFGEEVVLDAGGRQEITVRLEPKEGASAKPPPPAITKSRAGEEASKPAQKEHVLLGHKAGVRRVLFTPDGSRLVSGSNGNNVLPGGLKDCGPDNSVRIWNVESGKQIRHFDFTAPRVFGVQGLAVSADSRFVAACTSWEWMHSWMCPWVYVWDINTGVRTNFIQHPTQVLLRTVSFSPDCATLHVAHSGKKILSWSLANSAELESKGFDNDAFPLTFGSDKDLFLGSDTAGRVVVWEAKSGLKLTTLSGHVKPCTAAAISKDGTRILSASEDYSIRLWDVASGKELMAIKGLETVARCVALSPDGTCCVTGDDEGSIRFWDVPTGKKRAQFPGHTGRVQSVALSSDGKVAASGGDDKTVRVWRVPTPK